MGPRTRANAFSTNQGSVCASSFSVPPSATSPSWWTYWLQLRGSASNDGRLRGETEIRRSGVTPASDAFSNMPASVIRKPVFAGPTVTENTRPACVASLSRAHVSPSRIRLARSLPMAAGLGVIRIGSLQRQRLFGLLNPRQQPARRTVDRLDQVPDLDKRLWLSGAVLANQTVELHARDMLWSFGDHFHDLRVKRDKLRRHVLATLVELMGHVSEKVGRHHIGQLLAIASVIRGLPAAKLQLRLLPKRFRRAPRGQRLPGTGDCASQRGLDARFAGLRRERREHAGVDPGSCRLRGWTR